jgi:hypothetical protein
MEQLKQTSFSGHSAAIARFKDEAQILHKAGANEVFNIYTEAGAGFADHVESSKLTTNHLTNSSTDEFD